MKILIRGTNWIGDAVMTVPAIKRLRRLFPDAELVLWTPKPTIGIFSGSGLVDEIIPVGTLLGQIKAGKWQRADLAIIFPNSFKSALVACIAGIKKRIGYASQNRSMLLTTAVPVPEWKESRHEVYYYLNLVDAAGRAHGGDMSPDDEPSASISIPDAARETARQTLERAGIDPGRKIVGLAPGSTNSRAKRWTPESFARLGDRLRAELNVNVVLLGSAGDAEVSARVMELATEKPFDLTGKTDILAAAGVLTEIDLLISNDMGLAHLAPAVGTETIVIFGPTNPVTTRPFSDLATVVSAGVECSPCMLRDCPIDHRCMTRISADEVFELAKKKLNE